MGPGTHVGEARPRCTDSQAPQSCLLVRSQKSTAYDGSNPGRSAAALGNAHVHSMRVAVGDSGVSRCDIT